jgi:hypothetical protein
LIVGVLALACVVGWGVGKVFISPGPEKTPGAATASPLAQQMATADGGVGLPVDYQTALDSLAGKCTQGEAGIGELVENAHTNLAAHGLTTLTRLSMLQYLDGEMAAGLAKTDCGPLLSSYVTSKESG